MLPSIKTKAFRNVLVCVFSASIFLMNQIYFVAHAQGEGVDFEAPIIEHEYFESGLLGDDQLFSATVVDNDVLASVSLFYRFKTESDFSRIDMKPLDGSSLYSATVTTAGIDANRIEYYIQAADRSDNVVLKGFTFEPLIRVLGGSSIPTLKAEGGSTTTSEKKGFNLLYIALGVLAVGAIATSFDDGSSTTAEDCGDQCNVTIRIQPF